LQSIDPKKRNEILAFLRENKHLVHNVESLGEWDIEPEFEVENIEQFYRIMNEFRERFADNIESIDSMMISREHKYKYVPKA
jgi:hypothetical protein